MNNGTLIGWTIKSQKRANELDCANPCDSQEGNVDWRSKLQNITNSYISWIETSKTCKTRQVFFECDEWAYIRRHRQDTLMLLVMFCFFCKVTCILIFSLHFHHIDLHIYWIYIFVYKCLCIYIIYLFIILWVKVYRHWEFEPMSL